MIRQIFSGIEIQPSTSLESQAIDIVTNLITEGLFSLQITETGDGTAKYTYMVSSDGGQTYVEKSTEIVTDFTKISGPNSDGKNLIEFEVELCTHLKIKVLEIAGGNSIFPIVWIVAK